MLRRVLIDLRATARMFVRSKNAIFWTLAFPVLLMVIFGAIFGGMEDATYTINVQDLDGTVLSGQFMQGLNSTGTLEVSMIDASLEPEQYIKDHSLSNLLIIPDGFGAAVASGGAQSITLDLRLDQTSTSAGVISSIVAGISDAWNLEIVNASPAILIQQRSIITEEFSFIDFFLPGVIALTIMTSAVNYMVSINTRYRKAGLFAKFTTTPFTRMEFLMSRMLWQLAVAAMSATMIMVIGVAFFDVSIMIGPIAILLIVSGSILFSALGMAMSRFINEEETADMAASAVTFPMMFLAGSFFPLESMPGYLQAIAKVLPLTYLNDGLRDSMIYGNHESALINLGVVTIIAVALMIIGVLITRWKVD